MKGRRWGGLSEFQDACLKLLAVHRSDRKRKYIGLVCSCSCKSLRAKAKRKLTFGCRLTEPN